MTQDAVWEAEFSCSRVGIPPAVAGVDLVITRCLRLPGPVVPERRPERPRDEPGEITEDTKLYVISNLNITRITFYPYPTKARLSTCLFILF